MPTIFLIGDSTVEDNRPPFRGWGWALPCFTAPGVEVANHAVSGRSARSFSAEGRFEPVRAAMQPGDLLLIQFGHNDEKDTEELHTDPEGSFRDFLSLYCDAAIEKGALPVLISPVSRRVFMNSSFLLYTHGEYPSAMRRLAAERGIPYCDLETASRRLYLSLGENKTAELFVRLAPGENADFPDGHNDLTHFNAVGAKAIAELVARLLLSDARCRAFLRQGGRNAVIHGEECMK